MRIIFKDDILYVDIEGSVGNMELSVVKRRLFSILEQYEVDNVVVNARNVFNKKNMTSLLEEYHEKYNGNIYVAR